MAAGSQKQKLLVMKKFFETETDENHSVTGNRLIEFLAGQGIKAERKTIYDDIRTLIDSGMNIETVKVGHSNAYYLGERMFADVELLILADAVASSRFLSVSKSNQLLKKLQKLTSRHKAGQLNRCIHITKRPKSFNDKIYYSINELHEGIYGKKKVTFEYTEYNADKETVVKHGGARYTVSPYGLVWENENYYLICYCHKHEKICRYRVDRMKNVSLSEEASIAFDDAMREEADNLKSLYSMFGGEKHTLTMEFDNSLANAVIDKFGIDVHMRKCDDKKFSVTANVQISPTFWGWLFQFGDKAQIKAPASAVDAAKEELRRISAVYD